MKNTVSKGFIYYLFLLISVVCGVACILGAILIFSPNSTAFGVKYIFSDLETHYLNHDVSNQENSDSLHNLITSGKITTINFITDYVDLSVENLDTYDIRIVVASKISGIANEDNQDKFIIQSDFNESEKTYTFTCYGPRCNILLFSENSEITFGLPKSAVTSNLNINFITETGNFTAGKKTGDNYTFKNLSVKSTKDSEVYLGNKTKFTDNIMVDTQKGEINFNTTLKNGNSSLNANYVEIKTDSAKVYLQNVKTTNLKIKSETSSISIDKVDGEFLYDAYRGVLLVGSITGTFTCTNRVEISNIQIDKCYGEVLLPKANTSNLTINEAFSNCGIVTDSGNVTIGEIHGYANIETDSGSVTIGKIHSNAHIETNSGKINLTQIADKIDQSAQLTTYVRSKKSGDIYVNFENVVGLNQIISEENGDISVNFNNTLSYVLRYSCNEKAPTLSTSFETGTPLKTGEYYRGNATISNLVQISNNKGKTNIDDTLNLEKQK